MFGILAFISFVIACVIFFLLGADMAKIEATWGFFFVALGLALQMLGGAVTTVQERIR
jgi:hypothetical protein